MRKPRAIRLLTVVLAVLLSGCSEVRYYPYCVFGPDPKISSQNELHKRIVQFVQGVSTRARSLIKSLVASGLHWAN
jgi:hypothetical protein